MAAERVAAGRFLSDETNWTKRPAVTRSTTIQLLMADPSRPPPVTPKATRYQINLIDIAPSSEFDDFFLDLPLVRAPQPASPAAPAVAKGVVIWFLS